MKYAIAQASGKQILIKQEAWYDIDFLKKGILGDFLFLKKLLFFRTQKFVQIGQPFLSKSSILAIIVKNIKGKKLLVLKTKPKKNYTKIKGHRQFYTRIKILNIN